VKIINPTQLNHAGLPYPTAISALQLQQFIENEQLLLLEIPADYKALKTAQPDLGRIWREHSSQLFISLFNAGYLVTDFIHLPGSYPRSFYVLSHGESTL
jgi:predicted GNAT superfamily acetyltransferase